MNNNWQVNAVLKPALTSKLPAVVAERTEFFENVYLLNSAGATLPEAKFNFMNLNELLLDLQCRAFRRGWRRCHFLFGEEKSFSSYRNEFTSEAGNKE